MKNFINFLRSLILGEPNVGNAVKSLDRAVKNLEKAEQYQALKAERKRKVEQRAKAKAFKAVQAQDSANAEAERCKRVGVKIAKLLDTDD
jgi:hypothetical protein